ncbi:MAG TPA: hypothetical protein IGS17_11040 [Oscillatoriales cyanobacterium M59_W2019_021]|nr:MAG: hypothetical protein D6728_01910 [Cyanobacteria bacterium J055]HIK31887.1 hypothetical protein [Oscillatoriales cyanobacterium M4454_W2019_049]HIK51442.1 hypothetical protein [Oscillatoriales cyanobacterium M59_W2019_021]
MRIGNSQQIKHTQSSDEFAKAFRKDGVLAETGIGLDVKGSGSESAFVEMHDQLAEKMASRKGIERDPIFR